jgi:hypothetical protein
MSSTRRGGGISRSVIEGGDESIAVGSAAVVIEWLDAGDDSGQRFPVKVRGAICPQAVRCEKDENCIQGTCAA